MRQPVLSPVAPPLFPNGRDQSEPLAASWHPSARAKRTQSLSAAHETNVPVWLLGWSNRFLPALAAREPGLDPKQRRLTLDDQVIEGDDASLALVREQAGRPLGLIASSTAAALPGLARKLPHYGKYGYLALTGARQPPQRPMAGGGIRPAGVVHSGKAQADMF
jgi:hypothetical protein